MMIYEKWGSRDVPSKRLYIPPETIHPPGMTGLGRFLARRFNYWNEAGRLAKYRYTSQCR